MSPAEFYVSPDALSTLAARVWLNALPVVVKIPTDMQCQSKGLKFVVII